MKIIYDTPAYTPISILLETEKEAVFMFNLLGTVSRVVEAEVVGEAVNTFKVYQELRDILGEDADVRILAPAKTKRGEFY